MRLFAVTDARPQKNCPTMAMKTSIFASPEPSAKSKSRGAAFTRNASPSPPNAIATYESTSSSGGSAAIMARFITRPAMAEM